MTLERITSESEVVNDAASLISKYQNIPHFEKLTHGIAEETNNQAKGVPFNLKILETKREENALAVEMGEVIFEGLLKNENGWVANFTLMPEGIECPVGITQFSVENL